MSDTVTSEDVSTVEEKYVGVLTEEEHKEIVLFLEEEMRLAELERSGEEEEWKVIRRQRWARPEFEKKNTPWPGASNVCPPGAMIATNTVFGMTKNAFGLKKPFWSVEAMQASNRDDAQVAKTVEKYLQLLADSRFDLDKRERDREIQEESDSLGTAFVKVAWETEKHQVTLEGGAKVDAVFHDGPRWIVFPREEALYRLRNKDIQKARWFAQRLELEEYEVEERFASGRWQEFEGWKGFARTEALPHEADVDAQTSGMPQSRNVWDFYEVHLRWDLAPKDGFWEDLIVVFHRGAKVLVLAKVNPLGIRTIRQFNYIRKTFRLDGAGVGHAAMHMQAELEGLHNNRLNAVNLTTLKMFVAQRSSGIKPRETMSPGKIFFVDNVANFKVLETGEVYPSSMQAEGNAWQYLQRAAIMPESLAGFADQTLKSRDGLGMQTNRMKAASGILGSILEGMEDAYSDLGQMTWFHLVWNKQAVLENERNIKRLSDEELDDLQKALDIPVNEIPIRLRFSIRTSDVEQTFEARRQNVLSLWSIYSVYINQMIPKVMQVYTGIPQKDGSTVPLPPPVKEFILRTMTGQSKIMEKIFEFFGEDETGDYVPPTKLEEFAFELMDAAQEQMLRRLKNGQAGPQIPGALAGQAGLGGAGGSAGMEGAGQAVGNPQAGMPRNAPPGEGAAGAFPGAGGFGSFG